MTPTLEEELIHFLIRIEDYWMFEKDTRVKEIEQSRSKHAHHFEP